MVLDCLSSWCCEGNPVSFNRMFNTFAIVCKFLKSWIFLGLCICCFFDALSYLGFWL